MRASSWTAKIFIGLAVIGLWISETRAKAPVASTPTDPVILKALEETEKQAEIVDGTQPVCASCVTQNTPSPTPCPDCYNGVKRDDCWDNTAIHKFIMETDFSKAPDIVSRKDWKAMPPRKITPLVNKGKGPHSIVIHHSAGWEKTSTPKGIQESHMTRKKGPLPDIGYHYLIGFDKAANDWVVYEGNKRIEVKGKNGLKDYILAKGSHAFEKNFNRIGICFVGQFDSKLKPKFDEAKKKWKVDPFNPVAPETVGDLSPPPKAVALMGQLIESLMKKYPTVRDIAGHGSGYHYTCAAGSEHDEEGDGEERPEGELDLEDQELPSPNYSVSPDTKMENLRYDMNRMVHPIEIKRVAVKKKVHGKWKTVYIDKKIERKDLPPVPSTRYTECPGDHVYQIVESMRSRFLGEGKGYFVNPDVEKGIPGPACQEKLKASLPVIDPVVSGGVNE